MVDSHCHLADPVFAADLPQVIERACAAGVTEALCVIDALETAEHEQAKQVSALWPAIRTAWGVHPHRASAFAGRPAGAATCVGAALASAPAARAIGEVGLDYHYHFAPPSVQLAVFEAQIVLARAMGLPVVVHTREANADTVAVLKSAGDGCVRGVFHCFSGDVALARAALDLGFLVSFSGIVTFPKAAAIHDAARFVPDDGFLTETDCPYLAPVPKRGTRNEPALVALVVERLAELRGTTCAEVASLATANYDRLFHP
jgi:TatD DNase family protein